MLSLKSPDRLVEYHPVGLQVDDNRCSSGHNEYVQTAYPNVVEALTPTLVTSQFVDAAVRFGTSSVVPQSERGNKGLLEEYRKRRAYFCTAAPRDCEAIRGVERPTGTRGRRRGGGRDRVLRSVIARVRQFMRVYIRSYHGAGHTMVSSYRTHRKSYVTRPTRGRVLGPKENPIDFRPKYKCSPSVYVSTLLAKSKYENETDPGRFTAVRGKLVNSKLWRGEESRRSLAPGHVQQSWLFLTLGGYLVIGCIPHTTSSHNATKALTLLADHLQS
ncbi:hypothetical protein J6590_080886 [Homalodisca vitripennis]|nr:hypothetical protein J6590_080886 [Homalodisca vitripennis]